MNELTYWEGVKLASFIVVTVYLLSIVWYLGRDTVDGLRGRGINDKSN